MQHCKPTPRQLEILTLVAEGLTQAQIGERLFLAKPTVNGHIQSISEKLGSNNIVHSLMICISKGYLCIDGRTGAVFIPVPLDDHIESVEPVLQAA